MTRFSRGPNLREFRERLRFAKNRSCEQFRQYANTTEAIFDS
ncbi:MAG: hypothetical protein PV344_06535 [Anaplasma sp.]|nr:hypothetical protein [Anaplasma sp.]